MVAEPSKADFWPCACVKRDDAGNMSHIKLNSPTRKKCRVCGSTKDLAEKLAKDPDWGMKKPG